MVRVSLAQGLVFVLTYSAMFARHIVIGTWSISKPKVHDELGFSASDFGSFEFAFLITYALGNCFVGALIDKWTARLVVSLGLAIASISYISVRSTQIVLVSELGGASFPIVIFLWAIAGFTQSGAWPGGVSVVSNWFPKDMHGLVLGVWSTNSPAGSVAGQQLAGVMLGVYLLTWHTAFATATSLLFLVSLLYILFLRDHPKEAVIIKPKHSDYRIRQALSFPR